MSNNEEIKCCERHDYINKTYLMRIDVDWENYENFEEGLEAHYDKIEIVNKQRDNPLKVFKNKKDNMPYWQIRGIKYNVKELIKIMDNDNLKIKTQFASGWVEKEEKKEYCKDCSYWGAPPRTKVWMDDANNPYIYCLDCYIEHYHFETDKNPDNKEMIDKIKQSIKNCDNAKI